MIRFSFLSLVFLLPFFVSAQAKICFETILIDAGTIEYGSEGIFTFKFTNCGDSALVISSGSTSCGCVICVWPNTPIAPGKSEVIKLQYDTKRIGPTTKTATIISNAKNEPVVVLTIKCIVLTPKNQEHIPPSSEVQR